MGGEFDEAEREFSVALAFAPDSVEALSRYGDLLMIQVLTPLEAMILKPV